MHITQARVRQITKHQVVLSLLEVIGSLTELLDRETEALEKFQIHKLIKLINQKDELTEDYESKVTAFRTLNLQMGEIEPELLKQLQDKTRGLFQASERNKIAVQITQTANQNLIQWLIQAIEYPNLNLSRKKLRLAQNPKKHLSIVPKT